jgi:hypothetical protein
MSDTKYRDRTDHYVPDGLHLPAPWRAELGVRPDHRQLVPYTWGPADELNRDHHGSWEWVDVSPDADGSHWSHFLGHREVIDVVLETWNRREVHEWKGRDEIRAEGEWRVFADRVQIGEGYVRRDPLETLLIIRKYIADMSALKDTFGGAMFSWRDAERGIVGRKVIYYSDPAIVRSLILDQGCCMLDADPGPWGRRPWRDEEDDEPRTESAKVELLSPHIWWWRK